MNKAPLKTHAGPVKPLWWTLSAAFFEGFTQPSRIAAIFAVLSFALTTAFASWFFSPSGMAGKLGDYLPRTYNDHPAFATVKAVRLGAHWIEEPTILAVGSSTIAQTLSDGAHLTQTLRQKTGKPWQFISLTNAQQTPLERIALLETVMAGHNRDGPPMIILLGASVLRLTWSVPRMLGEEFEGRIGLRSDWVAEERALMGAPSKPTTGIHFLDNMRFYCLNGTESFFRLLAQSPAQEIVSSHNRGPNLTGSDRINQRIRDHFSLFETDPAFYLQMQRRLIDRLRRFDNVHVAYIDEPLAPDVLEALDLQAVVRDGNTQIAEFAAEIGVEYWTPGADAGLKSEDYFDALHVALGGPQIRIQDQLSAYILAYHDRMGL